MPKLPEEANYGRISSVRAILAAGGNVNEVDEYGDTASHYAAQNFNAGILGVLISAGADIAIKDSTGSTPLELAVRALIFPNDGEEYYVLDQGKDVVSLLVRNGADVRFIDELNELYSGLGKIGERIAVIRTWVVEALPEDSTATGSSGEEEADEGDAAGTADEETSEGGEAASGRSGSDASTLSDLSYSNSINVQFQNDEERLVYLVLPGYSSTSSLDQKPNAERQAYQDAIEEIRQQFEEENFARIHTEDAIPTIELPMEIFDVPSIVPLTMFAFLAAQGSGYLDGF